jgi:hypothetical protein
LILVRCRALLLALLVIDLLGGGWHRTDEALANPWRRVSRVENLDPSG